MNQNLTYAAKWLTVKLNHPRLLGLWMPIYRDLVSPAELTLLCNAIEETRHLKGPVVEIGCAAGSTTVFLNRFMDDKSVNKPYWCIDTFGGFTDDDVRFETENRGKELSKLAGGFSANSEAWFQKAMQMNGISRVRTLKADINAVELPEEIKHVSLCFIDVDLYRPVRSALARIRPRMAPGGVILVHDCVFGNIHDGAAEAYLQFCTEMNIEPDIECRIGAARLP
jgi:predicted O-methyltransferase YrrM